MSRPLFVGSYFQVTCWANEKEEINAFNGNLILYAVVGHENNMHKTWSILPVIQDKENIHQILTK